MNENDQELLESLRSLAMEGPREAPQRVEERLVTEFRRRARARQIAVWASISGVAAIAAGLVVMMWLGSSARTHATPAAAQTTVSGNSVVFEPAIIEVPNPSDETAMNFYELPEARELPPVENATVVRVELPMSSLRSIGFQINEARANEAVQADVLLGQDGLARGVRFVE
jgi:hypothetical protein